MKKIPNHDGFTLIELLVVVAIIAAIAVPGLLRARQSDNEASAIDFVHAEPVTIGSTGQRSFASDNRGTIYQLATGVAIANTMAGAQILQ